MTQEALRMAFEAMNAMLTHMGMDEDEWNKVTFDQMRQAIKAAEEALAQTQEPVALETLLKWDDDIDDIDPIGEVVGFIEGSPYIMVKVHKGKQVSLDDDLYATPPQRNEQCNYPDCKCPTENPCLKKLAQPEQEPVAWLITDEKINSLQVDSIHRLVDRARHAHMTDIKLRINGQDEWHQADWLKHLTRTTPPQPEQKPVAKVDANDEGYWAEILPDRSVKVGQLLYTTPPQRTWVGLTDEEIAQGWKESWVTEQAWQSAVWWAEEKLKEKNT